MAQRVVQRRVRRLREKSSPGSFDGALDARSQLAERARPLALRGLRPALQPTVFGSLGLKSRLMRAKPQEGEILIGLRREDRLEVELDICLACEGDIVAQESQR